MVACAHSHVPEVESPELGCRDDATVSKINQAEMSLSSEAPDPRPPERRSISLGSTFVPPRWLIGSGPMPWAAPHPMAAPVVINNYNQVYSVPPSTGAIVNPYYYPSVYSRGSSERSFSAGTTSGNAAAPRLGGDWPSVPSYGPKMQTTTAPGAVWPR